MSHYSWGVKAAQADLGLPEDPALSAEESEDSIFRRKPVPLALGAAAAASPFAGLIGEKKIIHDPLTNRNIHRSRNVKDFVRRIQQGDVLITGKDTFSPWKQTMSPFTGTEFYHAQPVVGTRGKNKVTATAGEYAGGAYRKATAAQMRRDASRIEDLIKEYPDITVMRPNNMTAKDAKRFGDASMLRSKKDYDTWNAVKGWAYDMFVPKIKGLGTNMKGNVICEGNVCSTMPAQALKETLGRDVVPGKPAKWVMPADYLRSDEFTPVTSMINSKYKKGKIPAGVARMLPRAAIGAGLGAGTYAVADTPESLAVPVGMAAALKRHNKTLTKAQKSSQPSLIEIGDTFTNKKDYSRQLRKSMRSKYIKNELKPLLLGGGLGLAAALGLNSLRDKKEE